jgi:glycosyltransferase involved in cell wall biosynthesis
VHPSEIPSYIEAADMIASPRCTGTNTPLKIYGYLRTGKPIIATDMLTHTQVLNNEVALLVPPNALGISEGISQLIVNPALGDAKVVAAKKLAEEKYSDAIYMHKVKKLYDAIN